MLKNHEKFKNARLKQYRSRIQVIVDDECLMLVEGQECTWAIFQSFPSLLNATNHKT